ncbi:kinase-like domain-containing protein [Aspergillus pseudodeflectus]|uniref:non-specific serine/threonine protein kinase n=1 Tax=Aspergillus pseudodeflectus TaxID=176178 RepID=A0ABR4KHT9_9EURO
MSSLWANITASSKSFLTLPLGQKSTPNAPEEPRLLPSSGFTTISNDQLVEEEELPDYRAERFYPVRLGEIFYNHYQIVAKLGFGSSSTTWLARDLIARQYVALKVYVHTLLVHREIPFYHHIASRIADSSHRGQNNIRRLLDSFELNGTHSKYVILVFEAAQMSLRDMRVVFRRDGFDEDFVKGAIIELLQALDFLHSQGEVVHTDIHPGNMLLGVYDNNLLKNLEEKESTSPVPRKLVPSSRTIYLSRLMRPRKVQCCYLTLARPGSAQDLMVVT